jgi:hypothetical protein
MNVKEDEREGGKGETRWDSDRGNDESVGRRSDICSKYYQSAEAGSKVA